MNEIKINPGEIPPAFMKELAKPVGKKVKAFFEDPAVAKEFEAWKIARAERLKAACN